MCLRLSIKQVIPNYSHCCNNTVLVGTYWLDSRVVGGTSCKIWSAPRFDLKPYAVSLVREFAARRCEIKWGVATFADDTKIFKTTVSKEDSSLLQADLRSLAFCSSSVSLAFNESKCKVQLTTGKLNPVIASYELNEHALEISSAEKVPRCCHS